MYNAGDPVVKMLPVQGAQIPSLVGGTEIPHARTAQQKKKKKKVQQIEDLQRTEFCPTLILTKNRKRTLFFLLIEL